MVRGRKVHWGTDRWVVSRNVQSRGGTCGWELGWVELGRWIQFIAQRGDSPEGGVSYNIFSRFAWGSVIKGRKRANIGKNKQFD